MKTNQHKPVLLSKVLEYLSPSRGGVYFDGTLGGGGHSKAILNTGGELFASDLDERAKNNIKGLKIGFIHDSSDRAIKRFENNHFDGVLADLGYSSNQLTYTDQGFSYQQEGVLDLRYNKDSGEATHVKIKKINEKELNDIIYRYSGEKHARVIAKAITHTKPQTTQELREVVVESIPGYVKKEPILSRVWQSLRIWTNDEFRLLENFLEVAPNKLKPGGRLAIICFHSLEDKMVTKKFRELSKPISDEYGNKRYNYKLITKKGVKPTEQEIEENIRSRSAILRVLEKQS